MTEYVLRLIHAEGGDVVATGNPNATVDLALAAAAGHMRFGNYLKWADVEAFEGRGDAVFTSKIANAQRFATFEAATEFWKQQSKTRPLRPDGKPNRPLTAFNVTIEKVP